MAGSVNLGDMVQVGSFTGVIREINTRYSVIRNTAGEELVVPNETFVTTSVKNFTGGIRHAGKAFDQYHMPSIVHLEHRLPENGFKPVG